MAGGLGSRMVASLGGTEKPLVEVGGLPLLERNVRALLAQNLLDLHIAIRAGADTTEAFVEGPCRRLVEAAGGALTTWRETRPLGNFGAVGSLVECHEVLVVFADNLTTMDHRLLLECHRMNGPPAPAMTAAVHLQSLPVPWGVVEVVQDRITSCREKPSLPVPICSGAYVLGRGALDLVVPGAALQASELMERVLAAGLDVRPCWHDSDWVDVNDAEALARAEAMFGGEDG